MSGEELVNDEQIQSILELADGDPELLEELFAIFKPQLDEIVKDLKVADEGKDFDAMEQHAHKLKGSAGNIGASKLFELCQRLETESRAGEPTDATDQISEIEKFGKASVTVIEEKYLSK